MSSHICNLIVSLKNGYLAKKQKITITNTSLGRELLDLLWDEGVILGYAVDRKENSVDIFLKYAGFGTPASTSATVISRPGRKVYSSHEQLCKMRQSNSLTVISTNKGLKSLDYCLRNRLGGMLIVVLR